MGNLRSINGRSIDGTSEHRRCEPRTDLDLGLTVWGVDTRRDRFLQETRARDISLSGALPIGLLLSHLNVPSARRVRPFCPSRTFAFLPGTIRRAMGRSEERRVGKECR